MVYHISGYDVEITYKAMKHIYLRVKKDGRICVSAPLGIDKDRVLSFVQSKLDWIEKQLSKRGENYGNTAPPWENDTDKDGVKLALAKELATLIPYWATKIGVSPSSFYIRDMKTRWGTCNVKTGRICINLRLGYYPKECLGYVVIHELCHLKIAGHTPAFYSLVATYCPEYKDIQKRLRHMP